MDYKAFLDAGLNFAVKWISFMPLAPNSRNGYLRLFYSPSWFGLPQNVRAFDFGIPAAIFQFCLTVESLFLKPG